MTDRLDVSEARRPESSETAWLPRMGMLALGMVAGWMPVTAPAGALYFYEMSSASETGYGGVGMTARASDAGTVFTNPAGMTRFEESDLLVGATGVYIDAGFSTNANNTVTGKSASVNKRVIPAGSAAYLRPLNDKWSIGISAQNYFGLAIDWPADWVGRAESVNVAILAPQVQPTVAYKVNDWLSIGAGAALTMGYLSEKLRQDALVPGAPDGKTTLSDTDFAVQGNFGIMLQPWADTRIGLRFLTETDLEFKDDPRVRWRDPIGGALPGGNNELDLGVKMPAEIQSSIHHRWNDKLNLLGSLGWAEISEFGRIQVRIDGTMGNASTEVDEDFRDVWNFGVGAEYQWRPSLQLTAGFHLDSSMSTDRTRPAPIPLGTLYRYAVGFKHKRRDGPTIGGGISYIYEGNLPVAETGAGMAGNYSNVALWIASVYANW